MTSADCGTLPKYLNKDHAVTQLGDADALLPMLAMLEESLSRDLPLIDACLQTGDAAGANLLLHPIKGFLPIFCSDDLCAELGTVEGLSKGDFNPQLEQSYAALRPKLGALLAEVSAFLQPSGRN